MQRQPVLHLSVAALALAAVTCETAPSAEHGDDEDAAAHAPGCAPAHASIAPPLNGPYCVGLQRAVLRDTSRAEPFTRDPSDTRELAIALHYPIEPGSAGAPAPYGDIATWGVTFGEALPERAFSRALLGADIARTNEGFPLLVYSPGFEHGLSDTNTFVIHELVSHGYAVLAVDHPYVSRAVRLGGERVARFGDDRLAVPMPEDAIDDDHVYAFPVVVADLLFALDHVLGEPRWRERLDGSRVAAFGHSYGGAAAAELARTDARVQAALDYDGRFHRDVVERGVDRPVLLFAIEGRITSDPPPSGNYDYRAALARARPGYYAELAGAIHGTFQADIGYLLERLRGAPDRAASGEIAPARALEILSALTLSFFEVTLRGGSSDALRAQVARYPEITFGAVDGIDRP